METREIIARNLNRFLAQSGMNQSELAQHLNVSKTAVSCWCAGTKAPRVDKLDVMADLFKVRRSAFYTENEYAALPDPVEELMFQRYHQLDEHDQADLCRYAGYLLTQEKYRE
jgi:transcriptional regulator with XRE-family HTH domain